MKPDLRVAVGGLKRHAGVGSTMQHRALVRISMSGARMRRTRPMRRAVDLVLRRPVARSSSRTHIALRPQHVFNIDNALQMHWHLRVEHNSVRSTASAMLPLREATRQPASSYAQQVRSVLPTRAAPSRTWLALADTRHSQRSCAHDERSVEFALSGTVANVAAQFASPAAWPLATLAHRAMRAGHASNAIRAVRAEAPPPRFDSRLASHHSDQASIEANDIRWLANVAASRYAPISLQARPEPPQTSTRREQVAPALNPWRAPRIELVWRKPAVQELADAQPALQPIDARSAVPSKADLGTLTSQSLSAPHIDAANTERLADEVLRRVERQLRIERERRGL
jgi:hypothetical protein